MLGDAPQGRVRECHGDLHCGNVVRWHGALTPFDGIEFDPTLRFIDVVNDIAFLTMDLAERGHADAAPCRAAGVGARRSATWTALPLLPYYEAYRALVRAKVDALRRAATRSTARRARAAAVADCSRYLAWARARLAPRRPPLVITCGLSGSGKTWLARRLGVPARRAARALGRRAQATRRTRGARADSRSPPDAGIYSLEFNERTYARLRRLRRSRARGR